MIARISGPDWRNWRHPDLWLLVILASGLALRLYFLGRPLDWLVSFLPADDFFYYANTAYHIVQGHGSTFDGGLTFHNGYHPLYLVLLLPFYALGMSRELAVYPALGILVVASLVSVSIAYRIGRELGGRWAALCPPLFLAWNLYFVKMSLKGFETFLVIALMLAVIFAALRGVTGWRLGILIGLMGLARVDTAILVVPLAVFLVPRRRWRDLLRAAVVAGAIVSPWVIWSTLRFGSPLPQSGASKMQYGDPAQFWSGWERVLEHTVYLFVGDGWRQDIPAALAFALGVIALYTVSRDWKRTGWLTLYMVLAVSTYCLMTNVQHVGQLVRYSLPALVVFGIVFSARRLPVGFWVPLALAVSLSFANHDYLSWVSRAPVLDTYVGLCQREAAAVVDDIAGPDDVVGSFDSGALGYFSSEPVINLDGLVNFEVVEMLREPQGGRWADRYWRYFDEKGITIMVGGTSFSWVNLFPDLNQWQELHPPIPSSDGGSIVFLRVPAGPPADEQQD